MPLETSEGSTATGKLQKKNEGFIRRENRASFKMRFKAKTTIKRAPTEKVKEPRLSFLSCLAG